MRREKHSCTGLGAPHTLSRWDQMLWNAVILQNEKWWNDEWYSRYMERLQTSGTGKTSPCLGCKLHQSKNAPNLFGQTLCSFERLKCDLKIISFGKCKDQVCAMVPTKWSIVAQLFGQNGRHAWWAESTPAVPERSEGTPEFCKVRFFVQDQNTTLEV